MYHGRNPEKKTKEEIDERLNRLSAKKHCDWRKEKCEHIEHIKILFF
jgi:hypothetical protein